MSAARARTSLILLGVLSLAGGARAMTLPEAIALARRSNPELALSRAEADAARARVVQANAGRLPTVTLMGQAGTGESDLGGFFGFERSTVHPRAAAVELRQPLFAGGAINAAVAQARAGREAAMQSLDGAQARLTTEAAAAYVGVLQAREIVRLTDAERRQVETFVDQAALRFKEGEIPRTDLSEAQARLAEVAAAQVQARGATARAEARFLSTIGAPPDALEPPAAPPAQVASLDDAVAAAARASPTVLAAQASLRAAEAGVRGAEAARLPTIAAAASASTQRDQFFPGYRNDGYAVGVEGRWTLFSGGLVSGRIDEARAARRGAEAALALARAQVRDAVIGAWADLETSAGLVKAAEDQSQAAASAVDSVTQEVRVGQKPMLDLLSAERESLAARAALVAARGEAVVAAYRLNGLLGAPR